MILCDEDEMVRNGFFPKGWNRERFTGTEVEAVCKKYLDSKPTQPSVDEIRKLIPNFDAKEARMLAECFLRLAIRSAIEGYTDEQGIARYWSVPTEVADEPKFKLRLVDRSPA